MHGGHQEEHVEHQKVNFKQSKEQVDINEVLPKENLQDEPEDEEIRKYPTLAMYVRSHHVPDQIIGGKGSRVMTRKRVRSNTCLVCDNDPKLVKDDLDNEHWIQAINKEIG